MCTSLKKTNRGAVQAFDKGNVNLRKKTAVPYKYSTTNRQYSYADANAKSKYSELYEKKQTAVPYKYSTKSKQHSYADANVKSK